MNRINMRRFFLQREEDETGISGTGTVVEGVEFSNGRVAIMWLSPYQCMSFHDNIKCIMELHGHGGKTRLVYIDSDAPESEHIVEKTDSIGRPLTTG
jgi:hypothetical protein